MSLRKFIEESNKIEGIDRPVSFMELAAHEMILGLDTVGVADLERFVAAVQPGAVLRREIGVNVRVGDHIAPLGGPQIEPWLQGILINDMNPFDRHREYLTLHPFTDGNGRSSRVLWLHDHGGLVPQIGFLHRFYYDTLQAHDSR